MFAARFDKLPGESVPWRLFLGLCLVGCADAGADRWERPAFCPVDKGQVERLLGDMTLERKAAQVLIVGGGGGDGGADEDTRRSVAELGVGGLFLPPLEGVKFSAGETARLIRSFQELALASHGVPLFIAVDQEGGHASVLNSLSGGTDTPGNLALGQTRSPRLVFDSYNIMGTELAALGINMDFAPVLDIMPDPLNGALNTRGFSDDPELVSELAPPAVWGLQNHRVLGTIKHAPGVGLTGLDTHMNLPAVEIDEETALRTTLMPFRKAIETGADGMMTGHIVFTGVDPDYAASMSRKFIRGIVRDRLGYEGLIVTDSVGMAGARLGSGADDPAARALIAGNDMVLQAGKESSGAAEKVRHIVNAVREGRLEASELDEAVRRVLRMKMRYCVFDNPLRDPDSALTELRTAANLARSQEAADASIVLHRAKSGSLPLGQERRILFIGPGRVYEDPGSTWTNAVSRSMGEVLAMFFPHVRRHEIPLPPDPEKADEYVAAAAESDVIVMATINAHYSEAQRKFLAPAFSIGKPVVLLTLGVPYDAWDFPEADVVLNVTGQRSVSLIAAAKALSGEVEARGRPAVQMSPAQPQAP